MTVYVEKLVPLHVIALIHYIQQARHSLARSECIVVAYLCTV